MPYYYSIAANSLSHLNQTLINNHLTNTNNNRIGVVNNIMTDHETSSGNIPIVKNLKGLNKPILVKNDSCESSTIF